MKTPSAQPLAPFGENARRLIWLIAGITAAVGILVVRDVVIAGQDKTELKQRLAEVDLRISKLQALASRKAVIERELALLERKLRTAGPPIPPALETEAFVRELEAWAQEAGLGVDRTSYEEIPWTGFVPQRGETPARRRRNAPLNEDQRALFGFDRALVKAGLIGTPAQTKRLLQSRDRFDRLVRWAEVKPGRGGLELTLEIYALSPETELKRNPEDQNETDDACLEFSSQVWLPPWRGQVAKLQKQLLHRCNDWKKYEEIGKTVREFETRKERIEMQLNLAEKVREANGF